MSGFKVEADFYFDAEVPVAEFLDSLQKEFRFCTEAAVENLIFEMDAPDVLDVSFIVADSNTYEQTMTVAKKFLDELIEKVAALLARVGSEITIEDDSLLLMPA